MRGVYRRGNVWWISWRDLQGLRHRESVGESQRDAARAREQRLADRRDSKFNLGRRSPTLSEFVEEHWRKEVAPTLKPSTTSGYESLLQHHLIPNFGALSLGWITRGKVRQFIAAHPNLAPNTTRNAISLLSAIMSHAVRDHDLLQANPIDGMLAPRNFPSNHDRVIGKPHFLEPLSFMKAVEAMPVDDRHPVLMAALSGLSWAEMIALKPGDVSLPANKLQVARGLWGGKEQTPKSRNRIRTVDLCPTVRRILAPRLAGDADGYLFPLSRKITSRWKAASGIRWHDLRHQYAVLNIMAGKHPRWIQAQMGHGDIRLTMNTYGGLMETLVIAHVEWIDDLLPHCVHIAAATAPDCPIASSRSPRMPAFAIVGNHESWRRRRRDVNPQEA